MIPRLSIQYFLLNQRRTVKGSQIVALGFIAIFATSLLLNGFSSEISIISSKLGKEDLTYVIESDSGIINQDKIETIRSKLEGISNIDYLEFESLIISNSSFNEFQNIQLPIHIVNVSNLLEGIGGNFANLVSNENSLFMTSDLELNYNVRIGDFVNILIEGQMIVSDIVEFFDPLNSIISSGVYISQDLVNSQIEYNQAILRLKNLQNINSILDKIEKISGISVRGIRGETEFLQKSAENIRNTLLILQVAISILVLISIFNLMNLVILESKYDIRILLTIGFSKRQVFHLFIMIGGIIGILGAFLTLVVSLFLVTAILSVLATVGYPFIILDFEFLDIYVIFFNSFLITLIAAIVPSYRGVVKSP